MRLKDLLGTVVENKKNKQLNVSLKKNKLKQCGISKEKLLNMKIDSKLNTLFED